ncbi:MAG: NAD(P)H-quinone oxidoreductase [Bowdeniella nasicola]|nr:NAD(P)H-quinone oxidoreductase [Bowdeniella nasicola]
MHAIDPLTLKFANLPCPRPQSGEVVIQVHAAGVNRADLLQVAGHYPPPPGASDILGLEVAGVVVAASPAVGSIDVGQRVMALLTGGGYAQYVTVPEGQCLPIPSHLDMVQAAALPEALATSYLNLIMLGKLQAGETVLIHGGSGGVGSIAIQLATQHGARVLTTAGSADKCDRCRQLGAAVAVNYHDGDAIEQLRAGAGGDGVDLIVDILGAGGLVDNLSLLATDARMVCIGMQRGRRTEIDLGSLLTKRLQLIGSTLRALPAERKAEIVAAMRQHVNTIEPQVHATLPLRDFVRAHQLLDDEETFGKIVLAVAPPAED